MAKIILDTTNTNINTIQSDKSSEDNFNVNQNGDELAGAFPEWDLLPAPVIIKRVRRSL